MRRKPAAALLIIACASPGFAQEAKVVDSHLRQQAELLVTRYADALNNGDADALAAAYAPDAIDVSPLGVLTNAGMHAPEDADKVHKMGLTYALKLDEVEQAFGGQGLIVTTSYNIHFASTTGIPPGHGNILFVLERSGEDWKIRAVAASRLAAALQPK